MTALAMMMLTTLSILLSAGRAYGAPHDGGPAERTLSDADILRISRTQFDKNEMMFKRVVLGRHNGMMVVASFPCGDVCPHYTRRIIHYAVPLAFCDEAKGTVQSRSVVRGIGSRSEKYCVPSALVLDRANVP